MMNMEISPMHGTPSISKYIFWILLFKYYKLCIVVTYCELVVDVWKWASLYLSIKLIHRGIIRIESSRSFFLLNSSLRFFLLNEVDLYRAIYFVRAIELDTIIPYNRASQVRLLSSNPIFLHHETVHKVSSRSSLFYQPELESNLWNRGRTSY